MAEEHCENESGEKALKAAEQALLAYNKLKKPVAIADTLRVVIRARCLIGERKEALGQAKEELARFRKQNDKRGEASMLLSMAETASEHMGNKQREEAFFNAQEAHALFKEVDDAKMQGAALLVLANIHLKKGSKGTNADSSLADAADTANDARSLFQKADDRRGEAQALHALAVAYASRKKFQDAQQTAKKALVIYQDLEDKKMESHEWCIIAMWHLYKKEPKEAVPAAEKALAVAQEASEGRGWEIEPLKTLVQSHIACGEMDEALDIAEEGLERFVESRDKKGEAAGWIILFEAHLANNDFDQARFAGEKAERLLWIVGEKKNEAQLYLTGVTLFLQRDQLQKALESVRRALKIFQGMGDTDEEAVALRTLCEVHLARGEVQEALVSAQNAKEFCATVEDKIGEALALLMISSLHSMTDNFEEALEAVDTATQIFTDCKDLKGQASALQTLARMHIDKDDQKAALQAVTKAQSLLSDINDQNALIDVLLMKASIELALGSKEDAPSGKKGKDTGLDKALASANEALKTARKLGDTASKIGSLFMIGQVHIVSQKGAEALKAIKEGLAICQENELEGDEGRLLVLEAYAHMHVRDFAKAGESAGQGLALLQKAGDVAGEQMANECLGQIANLTRAPKQMMMESYEGDGEGGEGGGEGESIVDAGPAEYSGPTVEILVHKLGSLVKDMFDVDDIEADTELMDIGLDSLSMLDFHSRIAKQFPGVSWSATMLFDYPTIAELGGMMEGALREAFTGGQKKIRR